MGNLIRFPSNKTSVRQLTEDELLDQQISVEDAVNELTHCMLTEVIKIYIDNRWSFAELDQIVGEFRDIMTMTAPSYMTRRHVRQMNVGLRDIWISIVESIRSTRI